MEVRWLIVVVCLTGDVTAQLIGCPSQWESYGDSCYQFVYSTVRTYEEAASACWTQGSALVSVNDGAEFRFIQEFLGSHVQDRDTHWYTSGRYVNGVVTWSGDGTSTNNTRDDSYWILPRYYAYTYFGNRLVYSFSLSRSQFAWSVVMGYDPFNYICEIPKREVERIIQQHRGFAFGYGNLSYYEVPKGPKFMNLPQNEVITDSILPLTMDCLASGTPQPSFKWYIMNPRMGNNFEENYRELTTGGGGRLTLSNGRLTVTNPEERADTGTYICEAANSQGSILSPPIEISFGYLDQFSPNQVGFVQALLMKGTSINCNAPSAKPALSYQWYKDDIRNFVRPELNKYFFISDNGNLYFSEVQETDRGYYYCVVTLVPRVNEILISHQPVSSTSRPIELRIIGNPSLDYGPIIHPDFIAVFPKPPIVGHDVRLECFAYGRLPMQYSWSRANGRQFPAGTNFMYENRVLIIPKTQFDATGNYTCHVQKRTGTQATDTRSFFLTLEAYPYFVFPLHDIHADVNSELTWRCEARAVPAATYTWYKNSKRLQHVPGQVEKRRNVLYIRSLDKSRDEGMYQCAAANAYGTNKTSAQLRVLSFPPNFNRRPLPRTAQAAEGGNLTLQCLPDAAPQADITWSLNGGQINPDGRREVFWDGSLRVTQVSGGDAGTYTCQASNINGEAHSNTAVTISRSVSIVLVMIGAIFFDIWRKEPTPNHTIKSLVSHYFIYRILRIVSKLIRMRFNRMCKSCKKTQASVLTDILNVNRKTRFFKDHGVDKLQTVEEFRQNVSLTTFTEYKTYVESIKQRGEENVLFPGPTQFLAVTSGTTSGKSKFIAKNMKKFGSIMIYVAAIYDTMYKIPGMKNLRRQLLATTKAKSFNSESGIQCGSISLISYGKTHFPFYATPNLDITTEKESMYVHLLYGLSDRFINMISAPVATNLLTLMEVLENKWESLCEDIERGSLSEAINISTNDRNIINTTLERRPDRAEELRKIFNNGFQDIVPKVWPHCLCATASKTGVFATAAQIIEERYLGGVPLNTWLHISTEAISGIVMELCPDEVHYVLAIPCCFFEFLPQSEVDSERPRLLMAHQVNVGETYEMVITTYDGLCRYRTEDMVEIVGFYGETPKYKFVRRAGDMLSANLEKVPEAILRESVYACAERGEWKRNIVEFITSESIHVQNPSGLKLDTKHYIVFIELDNEAILEETMKTDIDQELCFRHEVYSAMRENRKLEPIELVQIRHGTFSLVKRYILSTNSDAFSAHVKMPRVLRRKDIIDILMENVL